MGYDTSCDCPRLTNQQTADQMSYLDTGFSEWKLTTLDLKPVYVLRHHC